MHSIDELVAAVELVACQILNSLKHASQEFFNNRLHFGLQLRVLELTHCFAFADNDFNFCFKNRESVSYGIGSFFAVNAFKKGCKLIHGGEHLNG